MSTDALDLDLCTVLDQHS